MPYIVVTHPSLPVKNARELIALAKVNRGKLKAIGISGTQRYEPLPNVPVIAQTGLPGVRRDQLVSDDGARTDAERDHHAYE
jgi:tripartite-type tricarboxylate transporter receptor subunit TctC